MEEKIIDEQTADKLPCAEATEEKEGNSEGAVSLKKFKDEGSLEKAYRSLEAEFTKRSQKLKALEEENRILKADAETRLDPSAEFDEANEIREFFEKYPEAGDLVKEISAYIAGGEGRGKRGFMEKAYVDYLKDAYDKLKGESETDEFLLRRIEGSAVKDEIIRSYLSGVKNLNLTPALMGAEGDIALSPVKKPTTLREAALLAEQIIKIK